MATRTLASNLELYTTPEYLTPECDNTVVLVIQDIVKTWLSAKGLPSATSWDYLWSPEDSNFSHEEALRYDAVCSATHVSDEQIFYYSRTGEYIVVSTHICGLDRILGVGIGCASASAIMEYYALYGNKIATQF